MITQKHEDEMHQGEQRSSPVEEKQTVSAPSEGHFQQAPHPLRQWRALLFSIFGIAIPLVGGLTFTMFEPIFLQIWPQVVPAENRVLPILSAQGLVMGVSGAVGVVLLYFAFHAEWTCFLAPIAWLAGEFLSDVISQFEPWWWPWPPSGLSQSLIIGFAFVPLLICMVIGIAITIAIDALVGQRASRR